MHDEERTYAGPCDGDTQSYNACKKRAQAEMDTRYAALLIPQEQRRLRINLRKIFLANGTCANDTTATSTRPIQTKRRIAVASSSAQLMEWREIAITRERERRRRHTAASRIIRWWQSHRHYCRGCELPSTSEFVSIPLSNARSATAHTVTKRARPSTRHSLMIVPIEPPEYPEGQVTISDPFQVIIELLGVRDLPLATLPIPDHDHDDNSIVAQVRLVHQRKNQVIGQFETEPIPVDDGSSIQWENELVQIGINPETAAEVIQECQVVVDIFFRRGLVNQLPLGRLAIAMDLLETPLADKFAMTRWFPLERVAGKIGGGRPTRGEVRLTIRYLMRNTDAKRDGDDLWVPYSATDKEEHEESPPSPKPPTKRPARLARRDSGATSKPPLSPRRKQQQENVTSPLSPQQARRASPVRLRARVEAMSPPSSPSSHYSSDSNAVDSEASPRRAPSLSLPSPPRKKSPLRRQSSGGIVPAKAIQRRSSIKLTSAATDDRDHDQDPSPLVPEANSGMESPKPQFLKRKPYKVVFRKLDWSKVGSKTDSNLGSSASGKGGDLSNSSPQGVQANGGSSKDVDDIAAGANTSQLAQRLASVVNDVYSACKVTAQSAPLAQMKFRSERKRAVQAIQPLPPTDQPQSAQQSAVAITDEGLLQALWAELHGDADGSRYSGLLFELLAEKQ